MFQNVRPAKKEYVRTVKLICTHARWCDLLRQSYAWVRRRHSV